MDTINNDIFRFDNQYLKCIVTKYPSVLENNGYLANSGAMIIYQPQSETNQTYKNVDESYRRNYMYLGNEFLASGYGFLCKEMRNDAENIVKNYNTTINNLINKDNELNNKIDSNIENIQTKLEDNYIKKTGSITTTFININGQNVSTKDMLIYGEEAKYKNSEKGRRDAQIDEITTKKLPEAIEAFKKIDSEYESFAQVLSYGILHPNNLKDLAKAAWNDRSKETIGEICLKALSDNGEIEGLTIDTLQPLPQEDKKSRF